jgi:1,4-dihydroxy-2-naphthoate octaprenyltransferase
MGAGIPRFWRGVWRVADPRITLASVASMTLGAASAAREGPMSWGWLALTVVGIVLLEAAKNASGELFDFDSGTDLAVAPEDRSPFSGGKRVLVDGLLTRGQTAAVAAVAYALGSAIGLLIVAGRDRRVLWLGLAGVACAFWYHARPVALSYRGLGELAVAVCYGPLIASGTYLVQRGHVSPELVGAALPLGLLIAAFLWINELPDAVADRGAGKRTLVVRLGRRRAGRVFAALPAAAFALIALLPAWGLPRGIWLGLAGLPFAAAAARRAWTQAERTAALVPAQAWTLLAFLAASAGMSAGLLLAR